MRKIRWGVLSTAKIGTGKVIPAMKRGDYCDMVGIASRDWDKAKAVAAELGFAKAYGSYEDLLADPEIEAVYIPLPNHLHVPWSIKALEAGKHVLCEKPIGLTADEGRRLVEAAKKFPKQKVMEAFMYRHHPQWQTAKRLVAEGQVGRPRTLQMFFSYTNLDPHNIRNIASVGGGGLMDIGCYCVSIPRFIFGAEPQRVSASMEYDPKFGTDRLVSAVLDFGEMTSTFTCSTQLYPYQRVNIVGTDGRIEVEIPVNAPNDRPCRIWRYHGDVADPIDFAVCDQYTIQGDVFSLAILNDTPVPTPLTDAVANMEVIEAIVRSATNMAWQQVRPV